MKEKMKKSAGKTFQSRGQDIIKTILEHHKPLKKQIKILKGESEFAQKKPVFEAFAALLISHAKPEEEILYVAMKKNEDLRAEGFEGDTEHGIADQLVEEAKRTKDKDLWLAKVKVLAELVEHHLEEEEEDIFPDYRKHSSREERIALGEKYVNLREKYLGQGGEDSPHEKGGKVEFAKPSRVLREAEKHPDPNHPS